MEIEIFEKIKQFIVNQVGEECLPITRETELRKHLKLDGDDADEFLIAFGKTFSVDISQFPIGDYFNSEGNVLWFALVEWVGNLFVKQSAQSHSKIITIGDLERSVRLGYLR